MAKSAPAMVLSALVVMAALATAEASAAQSSIGVESAVNPIRRVVTMLQMMAKKVEAEGKKEEELYEKFMCYCKNGKATLGKSIEDAETKIPQLESDIKEAESTKAQLDQDVKDAKQTRADAKEAMAKATSMREKE